MWNAPVETVQIEVPRRLFRAMRRRPLGLLVAAFTGVSITFCPLFLYWLGRWGFDITDWRVLANFALIYVLGTVYVRLGTPVLNLAWNGGRTRDFKRWPFFVLALVIGLVVYFVSAWSLK